MYLNVRCRVQRCPRSGSVVRRAAGVLDGVSPLCRDPSPSVLSSRASARQPIASSPVLQEEPWSSSTSPSPGRSPRRCLRVRSCCNGQDMRVVHNAFLWSYGKAPGLVRVSPPATPARSELVGQWLGDLDATLHEHHHSEDQLLWDKLEQRAPACALHVSQMRAHHAQVQQLSTEAGPLLTQWRGAADPADRERLADAYERMFAVLKVHLRREVVEVDSRRRAGAHEAGVGAARRAHHGRHPEVATHAAVRHPAGQPRACRARPVRAEAPAVRPACSTRRWASGSTRSSTVPLFPGEPVPPTV